MIHDTNVFKIKSSFFDLMTDDDFEFPHIYSILHCTNFDRGIILKSLNQRFSNSRNAVC